MYLIRIVVYIRQYLLMEFQTNTHPRMTEDELARTAQLTRRSLHILIVQLPTLGPSASAIYQVVGDHLHEALCFQVPSAGKDSGGKSNSEGH